MRTMTGILVAVMLVGGVVFAQEDGERGQGPRGRGDAGMRGERGVRGERGMRGGEMGGGEMGGGQFSPELVERLLENEDLIKELGLTQEQIKKFRDGLHEIQVAMVKLRSEMELAGLQQAKLMTDENINEEAVMAAVEKAGTVRTEMAKLRIKQLLLVKGTFTKDQLSKIKQLRERRRENMRRRQQAGGEGGEGMANWRERMNKDDAGREEMRKRFKQRLQERKKQGEKKEDAPAGE